MEWEKRNNTQTFAINKNSMTTMTQKINEKEFDPCSDGKIEITLTSLCTRSTKLRWTWNYCLYSSAECETKRLRLMSVVCRMVFNFGSSEHWLITSAAPNEMIKICCWCTAQPSISDCRIVDRLVDFDFRSLWLIRIMSVTEQQWIDCFFFLNRRFEHIDIVEANEQISTANHT